MAVTGTQVFNKTMAIMGTLEDGVADTTENEEYKDRLPEIIDSYIALLYQYTDSRTVVAGYRYIPEAYTDLTDDIPLDDVICRAALPYGCAALLLADEDATLADSYQQIYEDRLRQIKNVPVEPEDIEDVYTDVEE